MANEIITNFKVVHHYLDYLKIKSCYYHEMEKVVANIDS